MIFLVSLALAAPDRVAAVLETTAAVGDLAVSPDGAFVAFNTSDGELILFDTLSWYFWNVETPTAATNGVALGNGYLAAGLSDGTIQVYTTDTYWGPAEWMYFEPEAESTFEIMGLAADSTYFYVAYKDGESNPAVVGVSFESGEYTGDSVTLAGSNFEAIGARLASAGTGTEGEVLGGEASMLYVAAGSDDVSRVSVVAGVVGGAATTQKQEGTHDLNNLWLPIGGFAWFADMLGNANSVAYQASDTSTLNLVFPSAPEMGECLAIAGVQAADGWFAAAGTDAVFVYAFTGAATGELLAQVEEAGGATQLAALQGYLFAGTPTGLQVLTDRPWVDITSVEPYEALPGSTVTVSFVSDMDGDFTVGLAELGTTATTSVATGSVVAGESTVAEIVVPEVEGSEASDVVYRFEVKVNPGDPDRVGRDADYFARNAAPEQLDLTDGGILAGDRRIAIEFEALGETDATSYDVYFSTVAFTAEDYPAGGPPFVGPDGTLDLPRVAVADSLTGLVKLSLDPVTNGTTYYVGVRAIDESVEGPMSKVIAVIPNETYAMSERLGIEGWCGLPLTSAGWLGAGLAALAAVRRRARPMIVVVLGAALLVPAVAQAKPHEDDLTARNFDLEFRYGPFLTQTEGALTDAFGSTDNRLLRGDIGWCSNFVEVDLGFGLWQDGGALVFGDGTESGDKAMLLAVPLAADATLRLDIWKEQPVVPYGRAGLDLWLWNESWQSEYDTGGGDSVTAGTFGWHWAGGLAILLDGIDLSASSRLETVAGVNDTYLVAEYRQSYALGDKDEILDFTSTDLTVGLKFDY